MLYKRFKFSVKVRMELILVSNIPSVIMSSRYLIFYKIDSLKNETSMLKTFFKNTLKEIAKAIFHKMVKLIITKVFSAVISFLIKWLITNFLD